MTNETTADTTASNEWRLVPVTATVEMLKGMSVACGIEPLPTLEEGGDYPITGSQSTIKRSWDAAIALAPVAPDALRAREQGYADQHRRDSQELRRLCAERDLIEGERDTLRAQLEAAEARHAATERDACQQAEQVNEWKQAAEDHNRHRQEAVERAEAAEADAARYRWLRDDRNFEAVNSMISVLNYGQDAYLLDMAELDAAIDAAKAATP